MKKTRLALFLTTVALISGCATVPRNSVRVASTDELPQIEYMYSARLAKISTGMSTDEFKAIFPEARIAEMEDGITIYEVTSLQKYVTNTDITRQNWLVGFGSPNPHTHKQALRFFFSGDGLKKWSKVE